MTSPVPHIILLERASRALGRLTSGHEFVFVGGACVPLYLDDAVAGSLRMTDDVDCVVEIQSSTEMFALEEDLRNSEFVQRLDKDGPICRWYYQDDDWDSELVLDIMPASEDRFGFSNIWYQSGLKHAIPHILPSGTEIAIFSAPFFLATKIEAFAARGAQDPEVSPDLEDIVSVIHGRSDLLFEIRRAEIAVRDYLAEFCGRLREEPELRDTLLGHLPAVPTPERVEQLRTLVERLDLIRRLGK